MLLALIFIPFLAGVLSLVSRNANLRYFLLGFASVSHFTITVLFWFFPPAALFNNWIGLDRIGQLILSVTSGLFLGAGFYAISYLKNEKHQQIKDFQEDIIFSNVPEAIFICCMLFLLASMTFLALSQHFGLIWVAIELTTLTSAPLIYFHRHHRSLEATWKYLMICSVGIAIALLGNFFLAVAASTGGEKPVSLLASELVKYANVLNVKWLKAAFIFILVGYGTKMGLAPMHTWLPDAHSEAPSVISSLLSGAMLNCAFLGIFRTFQVCTAAGLADFAGDLLIALGLVSMLVAAVYIIRQADYKRMLAYSSVEHMGIVAIGLGLGKAAVFGSMLHLVNHSLTKAALFLVAGNILAVYKTKRTNDVQGMFKVIPVSAFLWLAGILSITGFPPFGTFISEFTILKAGIEQGRFFVSGAYLVLLVIVFIGFATICIRMTQGSPEQGIEKVALKQRILSVVPPAIMILLVLVLGLFIPSSFKNFLHGICMLVGGN
ncbi:MAG: proton-conducting transporter membrane subunit [Sedimentisphaerales bacterium]